MALYNLIFQGQIIDGNDLDDVKANISRLFKADAAKTEALFSGKTIVIKKNLDSESAKKYLAVLKKAGAVVKAVKIEEPTTESSPDQTPQTETQPQANEASTEQPQTQASSGLSGGLASLVNYNAHAETTSEDDTAETEATETEESGLQLLPLNAPNFVPQKKVETIEIPDIAHLDMSEPESGSLAEFAKPVEPVDLPDIDNLSMSEANSGSMEEFASRPEAAVLPDISDLSVSEQDDTPLSSDSPKPEPAAIPDTSDLSVAPPNEGSLEGIEKKPEPQKIPDTSHLDLEKPEEKPDEVKGKAVFNID